MEVNDDVIESLTSIASTMADLTQRTQAEYLVKAGKIGNLSAPKIMKYPLGEDYHKIIVSKKVETEKSENSNDTTSEISVAEDLSLFTQRSDLHIDLPAAKTDKNMLVSHSKLLNRSDNKLEESDRHSAIKSVLVVVDEDDQNRFTESQEIANRNKIINVDEKTNGKSIYKCVECDYSSSNKHYLKQHVDLVHNSDRPYKCPFCDYAGKRSHSLREHLIVHSNERPFACSNCNATFRKKGHLTNHTKLHQKSVTCPLCQKTLMQAELESHTKTVHNVENVFVCEICGTITPNEQKMIAHMNEHKSQQIYVCSSCNYMTRNFPDFVKHAESHQNDAPASDKSPKPTSSVESKSPQIQTNPQTQSPKKEVLVKCSECGFVATSSEVMKNHMWKHIKNLDEKTSPKKSLYNCVDCDFVCEEAYNFVVHMLSHRPELQFVKPNQPAVSIASSATTTRTQESTVVSTMKSQDSLTITDTKTKLSSSEAQQPPEKQQESSYTAKRHDIMVNILSKKPKTTVNTPVSTTSVQTYDSSNISHSKDIKVNILSKKPGSANTIILSKTGNVNKHSVPSDKEIPAFVHDKDNARFLCMICGYTCEYQRTIKAHIWKHSGNKDIEYPMFQNGPLSIYDDSPFTREETATQMGSTSNMITNSAVTVQKVSKDGKEASVEIESNVAKSPKQEVKTASSVASALAHLLAARAMAGLNQKPNITCTGTDTTKDTEHLASNTILDVEVSKVKDMNLLDSNTGNCQPNVKEKIQAKLRQNMKTKVDFKEKEDTSIDSLIMASPSEEEEDGNPVVKDSISVIDERMNVESTNITKRKLDDSIADEIEDMSHVVKVFCTEEKKTERENVVVETVDTVPSLTGFTGMKSEQNSPRSSAIETEMDCDDSGIASDGASSAAQQIVQPIRKSERLSAFKASSPSQLKSTAKTSNADCDSVDDQSSDSAVTLLSLLKKGPNLNPACPVLLEAKQQSKEEETPKEDKKQKSGGISSSLLAVIEQLRERSRSETDIDEMGNKRNTAKKRIKKESQEDLDAMETFDNVERIEEEDEIRYRCKLCHYSNSSAFVMKQHMKLHKTKRPFECSLCVFMAESSEELQNHMIKHCKVRTYQCKLCPSAFNYKSQLRAHMRAHNEKDIFVCDECEFETNNPSVLRNHVTEYHETKQYACEVCEQRFTSKQELRTHKKLTCLRYKSLAVEDQTSAELNADDPKSFMSQYPKEEFKCTKCDYVTNSLVRFSNHDKTHDEQKNLKCDFCDFPALSNRSLKSHMKRHINDQRFVQQPLEQYKCNLCGYVCHHLPSLKSHMWRHASDENYSYEFTNEVINAAIDFDGRLDSKECGKEDVEEFSRTIREKLKQRLESQGKRDTDNTKYAVCWVTFRCCQCGFEVINKAQLNLHMKTHSDVIQWTLQVSQQNASQKESSGEAKDNV